MEVAGAAFPITPLLSTCSNIVKLLHSVGKRLEKTAPSTIRSIATECNFIHVALTSLLSFDWEELGAYGDGRQEQITRATEFIILGCTLTLSVIEEYANEVKDDVGTGPLGPEEQMAMAARIKGIWKEEEMRELLLQLRGYQTGLTSLLRATQDDSFGEEDDDASSLGILSALLQRSRASRSRKPLSIRAVMEQASAYSNFSRGANAKSPTASNNNTITHHSMATSINSSRSSKSVSPSSSIISSYGRAVSPPTTDGYDSGMSARGSRTPRGKGARKKRPAYLELQPEEPEDEAERVDHRTRREKDYLRRSSPTVAEHFKFVPGMPPTKMPNNDMVLASVAASANGNEHPPPPTGEYAEPSTLDDIEQSIDAMTEEIAGTPSPPAGRSEEDEYPDGERHLQKQQLSSSFRPQVITRPKTARLRKQVSSERVLHSRQAENPQPTLANHHSQLLSNQLQHGPTAQLAHQQHPPQTSPPKAPPPPVPQQGSDDQKASMQQQQQQRQQQKQKQKQQQQQQQREMYAPRHPFAYHNEADQMHPPRMHSLTRQAQPQAAVDRLNQNRSQQINGNHPPPLSLRPRRSASDAQRQQNLIFPMPPQREEDESLTPEEQLTSPEMPVSTNSDSWPLSPGTVRPASPAATQNSGHELSRQDALGQLSPDIVQHNGYPHSRNMSQASSGSQVTTRTYDLINTPRQSRSGTPSYGTATIYTSISTPRTTRSSGAGTMTTMRSDETGSTTGSVAPSVLSAQWYRNPRERQGLGPRISHHATEPLPWELGAEDGELEHLHQTGDRPKRPVFTVFPRDLSRQEREEHPAMDQQSQIPLTSEKFPISIKELPEASYAPKASSEADRSQSSSIETKSRAGAVTPAKDLLDLGGGSKKPKKPKKESALPSLKEMLKEYKGMTNKWYVEQYKPDERDEIRELDIHQNRSHSSQATRPSTGSSNFIASSKATPSTLDLQPHQESPFEEESTANPPAIKHSSDPLNKMTQKDRTVAQGVVLQTPSQATKRPFSPPPKSSGNISLRTNVPRPSGETASDKSSSRGSRMSLDGKAMEKKKKKPKKPSFLSEIFKEYKEMTNTWYTAPYQTEATRSGSTSTGRT